MGALSFFVKIVGATIEYVTILWILSDDQITICTFRTFQNVMHVCPVIGHEVAKLCLICAYPEIQAVVFIKLIL